MYRKKLESNLVRVVMPDASPEEIEEATRRWFGYLEVISRLVRIREEAGDSPIPESSDTLSSSTNV